MEDLSFLGKGIHECMNDSRDVIMAHCNLSHINKVPALKAMFFLIVAQNFASGMLGGSIMCLSDKENWEKNIDTALRKIKEYALENMHKFHNENLH